ncbi:MAG: hypothetical protein R2704_17740 [Microthrixaceae bacterium]
MRSVERKLMLSVMVCRRGERPRGDPGHGQAREEVEVSDKELAMASSLIDSLTEEFELTRAPTPTGRRSWS